MEREKEKERKKEKRKWTEIKNLHFSVLQNLLEENIENVIKANGAEGKVEIELSRAWEKAITKNKEVHRKAQIQKILNEGSVF